jgi:hypothetical protein
MTSEQIPTDVINVIITFIPTPALHLLLASNHDVHNLSITELYIRQTHFIQDRLDKRTWHQIFETGDLQRFSSQTKHYPDKLDKRSDIIALLQNEHNSNFPLSDLMSVVSLASVCKLARAIKYLADMGGNVETHYIMLYVVTHSQELIISVTQFNY